MNMKKRQTLIITWQDNMGLGMKHLRARHVWSKQLVQIQPTKNTSEEQEWDEVHWEDILTPTHNLP